MPFQIFSHLWAVPPASADTPVGDGGLGNTLGDVLVSCLLCGGIIEGDGIYTSAPRFHSLDSAGVDYCVSCYELVKQLEGKVSGVLAPYRGALHLDDAFVRESTLIYWSGFVGMLGAFFCFLFFFVVGFCTHTLACFFRMVGCKTMLSRRAGKKTIQLCF